MHPLVHATKFFSCADIMFREPIAWISSPTLKFVVLPDFKIWKLEIWQNQTGSKTGRQNQADDSGRGGDGSGQSRDDPSTTPA